MENLEKKVMDMLKDAMKNKDNGKVQTLRMIKSAIQYYKIEKGIKELSEADAVSIISKMVKQRKESIDEYSKAGREDLVKKEQIELEVLNTFMPEQLDDNKLREELQNIIKELGAEGKKDFGKVMKEAMNRLRGRADGKKIKDFVTELLSL